MVTPATERKRAKDRARLAELGIDLVERPRSAHAKFHNVSATYKGERYDSAGEAQYAQRLDLMAAAGEIADWERAKAIAVATCGKCLASPGRPCLSAKGVEIEAFHRERVTYKPDFYIVGVKPTSMTTLKPIPTGYFLDYKGSTITETAAWRIKVRLWRLYIPYELRVAYSDGAEKVVCTGNDAIQERLKNG